MTGGARRSLASPVVSGVLCQCGGGGPGGGSAAPASSPSPPPSNEGMVEPERRLRSLFLQLDVNRDGALCVHDLAVGLERLGLHRSERDLREPSLLGGKTCQGKEYCAQQMRRADGDTPPATRDVLTVRHSFGH